MGLHVGIVLWPLLSPCMGHDSHSSFGCCCSLLFPTFQFPEEFVVARRASHRPPTLPNKARSHSSASLLRRMRRSEVALATACRAAPVEKLDNESPDSIWSSEGLLRFQRSEIELREKRETDEHLKNLTKAVQKPHHASHETSSHPTPHEALCYPPKYPVEHHLHGKALGNAFEKTPATIDLRNHCQEDVTSYKDEATTSETNKTNERRHEPHTLFRQKMWRTE